jgi:RimJ/RimL family protein N-acetyltransferase
MSDPVTVMSGMEWLRTERLVLRQPREEDAPLMFERWTQDPEVTRFLTWRPHTRLSEAEAFVRASIAAWTDRQHLPWIITLAQDDSPIGMIELRPQDHRASVGYVLARSAWGNGYMTEAARELVARVIELPEIWRVWAVCDVDNLASARVLERAGMEREGTLRRYIMHPNTSAEPRDVHIFARVH